MNNTDTERINHKLRIIAAKHWRSLKHKMAFGRQHAFQIIFILLQLALIVMWFLISRRYIAHFYMLCEFVSFCVVMHIVREDSRSSFKIPWIIVNLLLPIVGGLSYLMFGRIWFSRDEQKRIKNVTFKYANAKLSSGDAMTEFAAEHPWMAKQAEYIRNAAAAPIHKNTAVRYFASGEEMYPCLLEELEKAERFIFMEYFIVHPGLMWDKIQEILVRKAAQGVEVCFMYDSIGSVGLVPPGFVQQLQNKGINAVEFNKLTNIFSSRFNNRDHRKICVIDGNVGFTGGINLADEYINHIERFGYWKDTAVMIRGDAVRNMTLAFLSLWEYSTKKDYDYEKYMPSLKCEARGYVQPYMDMPYDDEPVGENVYRNILCRASDYVYITTPYLIIDDELINALTGAAKCGVDVRIITPGIPDKKIVYTLTRSYYEVLLRSGVRIYEYTPGFMHAKMFVSDDECAVVGTINLDYRSLCHHFENAVWMCDVPAIKDVKADIMQCFEVSKEVTLDMCRSKNIMYRLGLSLLRIVAPLF